MKHRPALLLLVFALGAGRAAAAPAPSKVVVYAHTQVQQAFAQGLPLTANDSYKISAGRRVAPGNVEIHTVDTDIFYVQEGSATFVTGGTAVDAKPIGPDEIRGTSITGGTAHHLVKGDVIVIPKGTPHQFTEVDGPFLYFVVKVTR